MRLNHIRVSCFRRFTTAEFSLHPKFNVLVGANATGKTSLLEAIFIGCRGQSFRARKLEEAIQEGERTASVVLQAQEREDLPTVPWSAGFQRGEMLVQRMGQVVSRREQARALPLVLVDRQLHRVFEDAPIYRRRYLDWGLFYVEQTFFEHWRRYERALSQRNSSLRAGAAAASIEAWDLELAVHGEALHGLRMRHAKALQERAQDWLRQLLDTDAFGLELRAGWDQSQSLADYLQSHLARDRSLGYTLGGPHRAELRVRFEAREARSFVSRGQQKMLSCAMALAQASLVLESSGIPPVFLLDDIEAELSLDWQKKLVSTLLSYPGQSVISSLEWQTHLAPPSAVPNRDYSVFHVEQGQIIPA